MGYSASTIAPSQEIHTPAGMRKHFICTMLHLDNHEYLSTAFNTICRITIRERGILREYFMNKSFEYVVLIEWRYSIVFLIFIEIMKCFISMFYCRKCACREPLPAQG